MLDLKKFEAFTKSQEEGVRVVLLDPQTKEPTTGVIWLALPESRHGRNARRDSISSVLMAKKNGTTIEHDPGTEFLARCIVRWEGIWWDEKEFPHTVENAIRMVVSNPWIELQLDDAASTSQDFPETSPAKS